jgi:hypothetical protein
MVLPHEKQKVLPGTSFLPQSELRHFICWSQKIQKLCSDGVSALQNGQVSVEDIEKVSTECELGV